MNGVPFCSFFRRRKENGAATKNRTRDLLITNQLLYLLSYSGTTRILGQRRHRHNSNLDQIFPAFHMELLVVRLPQFSQPIRQRVALRADLSQYQPATTAASVERQEQSR